MLSRLRDEISWIITKVCHFFSRLDFGAIKFQSCYNGNNIFFVRFVTIGVKGYFLHKWHHVPLIALWHHSSSLPYQFSIFEDVDTWLSRTEGWLAREENANHLVIPEQEVNGLNNVAWNICFYLNIFTNRTVHYQYYYTLSVLLKNVLKSLHY